MLRTDAVIKLLKTKKQEMSFDEIWANVKEETLKSIKKEFTEDQIKADLYMSLIEEQALIMIGDSKWDLKEKFSYDEIHQIEKTRMTEELELDIAVEKSDDTRELKLEILADNGEE